MMSVLDIIGYFAVASAVSILTIMVSALYTWIKEDEALKRDEVPKVVEGEPKLSDKVLEILNAEPDDRLILLLMTVLCIYIPVISPYDSWADPFFSILGLFGIYKFIVSYTHDKKGFLHFPNAWKLVCILLVVIGLISGISIVSNAWVSVSWVENGSDLIDSLVDGVITLLGWLENHGYIEPRTSTDVEPDPIPPLPDEPDPPHHTTGAIQVEYFTWL